LEDQERDETIELSSDSSSDDEVDEENMGDEMAALASKVEDMMIPGIDNDLNSNQLDILGVLIFLKECNYSRTDRILPKLF
jgi:hypothetical protein